MADYYDESEPSQAQEGAPSDGASMEDKAPAQSTLIPKSMCPGMKVGQQITLTIDKELEDEYQVSYDKAPASGDDGEEAGETAPDDEMME